jgi:23S rRNA pseudouridine1911/1915/1917 synthase
MPDSSISLLGSPLSLNKFLQDVLGVSRHYSKKFFSPQKFKHIVQVGEELSIPLDLLNRHHINPEYEGPLPNILEENSDWLVLEKPANVHCHPLSYSEKNNCLSFLRAKKNTFWPSLQVNWPAHERGLLYRLDYGTSGVLIYIKNPKLYAQIRAHFPQMCKEKIYYAVVPGEFKKTGHWRHYFIPSGPKGGKMKVLDHSPPGDHGQWGELSVQLEQHFKDRNQSLVKICLQTGLRHQVRAQLAFLGSPILGDHLYGGPTSGRIYLHAGCYAFELLGKTYRYRSDHRFFSAEL